MNRGDDLTRLYPQPTAIALAGRSYVAGELNFGSLAKLQAILKALRPHPFVPLEGRRDFLVSVLGRHGYHDVLVGAVNESADWPLSILTGAGLSAVFDSPRGWAGLVRIALGQHGQHLTEDEAADLSEKMSPAEIAAFIRAICPVDMQKAMNLELSAWTDTAIPPPSEGGSGWIAALTVLMAEPFCFSYSEVMRLTPGAVNCILARGAETSDAGMFSDLSSVRGGWAEIQRRKRALQGLHLDAPEAAAAGQGAPSEPE